MCPILATKIDQLQAICREVLQLIILIYTSENFYDTLKAINSKLLFHAVVCHYYYLIAILKPNIVQTKNFQITSSLYLFISFIRWFLHLISLFSYHITQTPI